jgi:hypothetical protein
LKKWEDLSGQSFGKWNVLARHGVRYPIRFLCQCQCGLIKSVRSDILKSGKSKACMSCGRVRHGHSIKKNVSPTYNSWRTMINRCVHGTTNSFEYYGGRGVKVSDRWRSFENFLKDMGERPEGMELDRIDNDGDYEPSNCRWVSHIDNCNNPSNMRFR